MSLRTIQRIAFACGLALVGLSATACKDDNKKKETDAGKTDAGGGDGDMTDAGMDSGMPEELACNPDPFKATPALCTCEGSPGTSCGPHNAGPLTLSPCCDTNHNSVCGVAVPQLAGPLAGCHQEKQEGADSQGCSAFLDTIEGKDQDHTNGLYDVDLSLGHVQLAGCCAPTGVCGIVVNEFDIVPPPKDGKQGMSTKVTSQFGCIPVTDFAPPADVDAGTQPDAGTPAAAPAIFPFCAPSLSGSDAGSDLACPPKLTIPLPGAPVDLCEKLNEANHGILIGCDPTADFPAWACLATVGHLIDGSVPKISDEPGKHCMEYLPEFVQGCGDTPGTSCVPNVPADVFGCVDVDKLPADAQNQLLAGLPDIACGCGDGTPSGGVCIPNLGTSLCGTLDIESLPDDKKAAAVAKIPDFICGCGAAAVTPLCLRETAATLCGGLDVENLQDAAAKAAILAPVPDFLCGCGDATPNGLCLRNNANTVCGGLDIDGLDDAHRAPYLAGVPDFMCGCGDATPNGLCLRNDANTICGGLDLDALDDAHRAPYLAKVPDFLCGCGDATPNGLCLRNEANTICGGLDVDTLPAANQAAVLANVPEFLCGCGNTTPNGLCLRNDGNTICGGLDLDVLPVANQKAIVAQVPNMLCGCGDGVATNGTCLNKVGASLCGQTAVCAPLQDPAVQGSCSDAAKTCQDKLPIGTPDGIADGCY